MKKRLKVKTVQSNLLVWLISLCKTMDILKKANLNINKSLREIFCVVSCIYLKEPYFTKSESSTHQAHSPALKAQS